jgi:hypothetical protein
MITERAMLAAIHISIWTAVKHDRKVSHEVASQHGAPVSAGRYNKQLLRGAGRLDDLRTETTSASPCQPRSRRAPPARSMPT